MLWPLLLLAAFHSIKARDPPFLPSLNGSRQADDYASMLQKAPVPRPHIVGLRRESVPVYRRGKVASFKTSYSGAARLHVELFRGLRTANKWLERKVLWLHLRC